MGLVVNVGLSRFFYGEETENDWTAAVRAIVESGATDLVRDALLVSEEVLPDTRIYEARRRGETVEGRFLEGSEAQQILDQLRATFTEYDTFASFAWAQLDDIGAYDVWPLAVVFDHGQPTAEVRIGDRKPLRIIPIDRSRDNFGAVGRQCEVAWALHELAAAHRLIIHCA